MAGRPTTCERNEETWNSLFSELITYLSGALRQVEDERLLVQRNCESCRLFLSEYKTQGERNEADVAIRTSEYTMEVNRRLQDKLTRAEAVLGDARALRQGKAGVKNSARPIRNPGQKKCVEAGSAEHGDCNDKNAMPPRKAAGTPCPSDGGRPRGRSRSLAPLPSAAEATMRGKRASSSSRQWMDSLTRTERNALSAKPSPRIGSLQSEEDDEKNYTDLTVPPDVKESYREFERAATNARAVAGRQVSGRARFLELLGRKVDVCQPTAGTNADKCLLTDGAVPTRVTYSSVSQLRELAHATAKLKEVRLKSYLVGTCGERALLVLRNVDRNDRNFVALFRCIYGIVVNDGRSFPVFVKDDGEG